MTESVAQTYAVWQSMPPACEQAFAREDPIAHNGTSFRKIVMRSLAVIALLCIYGFSFIGGSALLLGATTTSALARGGGHGFGGGGHGFGGGGFRGFGGGFRGGGFRGAGIGLGLGLGYGAYYPYGYDYPYGYGGYYDDAGVCYVVRQRVMTRHGWRIRRVSICE